MGTLSQILSSRVRAEVFRLLFGLDEQDLHVREIARRAGRHEASVRQELKKLLKLQLVEERRDGNRVYFRANKAHPLHLDIHRLVLKTSGLVDVLRDALGRAQIDVAFVFGSVATGTQTAASDIDLMVVGEIGLRKLAALLAGTAEALGREINPHVMSATEYKKRVRADDHFAIQVLSGEKLYVIGNDDDLGAMAQ